MLPGDMVLESVFLKKLAAFSALEELLRAIFEMDLEIALLDPGPASICAVNFEFIDHLLQAHICPKPGGQIFFAVRTDLLPKLPEAELAEDGAALLAVEWHLWQFKANYAFQLLES